MLDFLHDAEEPPHTHTVGARVRTEAESGGRGSLATPRRAHMCTCAAHGPYRITSSCSCHSRVLGV